jgi:hypothetical protein
MASNTDRLIHLDSLDPAERLAALALEQSGELLTDCERALLELYVIDELIESMLGASSIYLIGSATLSRWFTSISPAPGATANFIRSLLLLNESDLIFRFTCAKKFLIADTSLKQLRINSWGKLYIREQSIEGKYPEFDQQLRKAVHRQFVAHQEAYRELVVRLRSPITASNAAAISQLNKKVSVKLLS